MHIIKINFMFEQQKNALVVLTILHFVSEPRCHQIKNPEECSSGDFLGEYIFKSNWTAQHILLAASLVKAYSSAPHKNKWRCNFSRDLYGPNAVAKPLLCVLREKDSVYLARRSGYIYIVHSLRPACVLVLAVARKGRSDKRAIQPNYTAVGRARACYSLRPGLRDARLDRK